MLVGNVSDQIIIKMHFFSLYGLRLIHKGGGADRAYLLAQMSVPSLVD